MKRQRRKKENENENIVKEKETERNTEELSCEITHHILHPSLSYSGI